MKPLHLLQSAFLLASVPAAYSVEFYSADFSVDGQGSTHDTSGDDIESSPIAGENWTLRWDVPPASDGSSNSFITQGGKLVSADWGGRAIFETDAIDVSAVDSVTITAVGMTVGSEAFNSGAEDFTWFYVLDNGSRVSQAPIFSDGPLDYSEGIDVSGASSLVVGFEFEINGAGDGFEISTVRVDDAAPVGLSLSLPERLAETDLNGGMTSGTGEVSLAAPADGDVTINLTSSDETEATVPASVTIADGQTSAQFTITAVDDAETDGEQSVTITASAEGFTDSADDLIVEDDEVAAATISLSAVATSIDENGGTTEVTIEVNVASATGYTFDLSSDDVGELTVPASVMIAPDATTATFTATGVDDADSDGTQTVVVTASDPDTVIESATLSLFVSDDEAFMAPAIVINEFRTDNAGTDTEEYLEIFGATADFSLDRISLIVLGDGAGDFTGFVERVYDLNGLSASGNYFLIGNDNMIGATPDLTVGTNIFENNDSLTFLLVTDFSGAANDDLDTDNDGTLDVTPWGSVIDAVSILDTDIPGDSGGYGYAESLGFMDANIAPTTAFTPAHVFRSPNGTGSLFVGPFGSEEEPATDSPNGENGTPVDPPTPDEVEVVNFTVDTAGGTATLVVKGLGDKVFILQSSTDLNQSDVWAEVVGGFSESDNPDGSTNLRFTYNPVAQGKLFYRLIEQP